MKTIRNLILALLMLCLMPGCAMARGDLTLSFDPGEHILLLLSPQTGQILFAQNEHRQVPVASVTKIMTLILTFEAIEKGEIGLDTPVTVTANAAKTEGSQAFLDAGSTYPLSDLIRTVIIASANDSCVAVAETLAGSEQDFVNRMNERARELGMNETQFRTCTGLPCPDQYSTAYDVSIMAAELLKHDLYFTWSSTWMDTLVHPGGRETELTNTNRLIRFYEGADGVKTGYSSEAGHCLAATAVRGGMRLLAVVLGYSNSKTRFTHAQNLLNAGFDAYDLVTVAAEGESAAQTAVRGGDSDSLNLLAGQTLQTLIRKGQEADWQITRQVPEFVRAPIQKGDVLGSLTLFLSDGTVKKVDLLAEETIRMGLSGQSRRILSLWCR